MTAGATGRRSSWRTFVLRVLNSVVLTNILLMGVAMLGTVVTARYLGVAERGMYLTWSSWSAMVGTLAMLGTQSFIVVAAEQLGTRVSIRAVMPLLYGGMAVATVGGLTVTLLLRMPDVALVGGICQAVSGPIVATQAAVQQANGDHGWRFNLARALSPITGFGFVMGVLVWLKGDAVLLFAALGAGCLVGAITAVAICWRSDRDEAGVVRKILRLTPAGAPLVLLGWLILNVDTLTVSLAGDDSDVGIYGIGVAARSAVLAIGTGVGLRWFAKRDRLLSFTAVGRQFLPVVTVAAGGAFLAPIVIPWILGSEFTPSVAAVRVQALAGVLASVDFLLSHMILLRSGFVLPVFIRAAVVAFILAGIVQVGGEPLGSAFVFTIAMSISIAGQAVVLLRARARRARVSER